MAFRYHFHRPVETKRYLIQLITVNSFKCLTIVIFTTWLLIASQRNLKNKKLVLIYKLQIIISINIKYVVRLIPSIDILRLIEAQRKYLAQHLKQLCHLYLYMSGTDNLNTHIYHNVFQCAKSSQYGTSNNSN